MSGREEQETSMELQLLEQPPVPLNEAAPLKYVDDLTIVEHHYLPVAETIFSTKKPERMIHAEEYEGLFETITENSNLIGMQVNPEKTQLLCVSSNNYY